MAAQRLGLEAGGGGPGLNDAGDGAGIDRGAADAGRGVSRNAADIGHTIHPHTTLSETIGMAAEMFEGTINDLIAPEKK